jgi:hypothetical protein
MNRLPNRNLSVEKAVAVVTFVETRILRPRSFFDDADGKGTVYYGS